MHAHSKTHEFVHGFYKKRPTFVIGLQDWSGLLPLRGGFHDLLFFRSGDGAGGAVALQSVGQKRAAFRDSLGSAVYREATSFLVVEDTVLWVVAAMAFGHGILLV